MRVVAGGPGIGDAVILSALAHESVRQGRGPLDLVANHGELYNHDSTVASITPWSMDAPRSFPELDDQRVTAGDHNIRWMCWKLGLEPPRSAEIRCYLQLSPAERTRDFTLPKRYVTMHVKPGDWTINRNWPMERWRELCYRIRQDGIDVIQVGGPTDLILGDASDAHLGQPLRSVAFIIHHAALHVCSVSGLMHVASGVGTRSVVIYGGRENPLVTGYPANVNLQGHPPQGCDPCWLVPPCPYLTPQRTLPCTDLITVDKVLEEVMNAVRTN